MLLWKAVGNSLKYTSNTHLVGAFCQPKRCMIHQVNKTDFPGAAVPLR